MVLGLGQLKRRALGTTLVAAFLASLVECVEALTVVLAVGSVRGWPSALAGAAAALGVLAAIVAAVGPALTRIPLHLVQLVVGAMILLFGMRWLRKAILRAAGLIALHDEEAAFAQGRCGPARSRCSLSGMGQAGLRRRVQHHHAGRHRGGLYRHRAGRGRARADVDGLAGRGGCVADDLRAGSCAAPAAGARAGEHAEVCRRRAAVGVWDVLGGRGRGDRMAGRRSGDSVL